MGRNDGRPRAARHKQGCQRENPSRRGLLQSETAGQRAFWKYSLIDLLWEDAIPLHEGQTAGARTRTRTCTCPRTQTHTHAITCRDTLAALTQTRYDRCVPSDGRADQNCPQTTRAHVHAHSHSSKGTNSRPNALIKSMHLFHVPLKTPR